MGKKLKDFKPEIPNSSVSLDNIFKSLFGTNNPTSGSIFSDSNPFRSKLTDESQKLLQVLRLDVDSPPQKHTQITESSNKLLSKRKRRPNNIDQDDSDIELDVKKSKLEDGPASESLKSSAFDKDNKKKKRKRAEVEAEYDERKYGRIDFDSNADVGINGKIGEKRKELDKGEFVVKEGFDDEEKLLRTVFVGNLPLKVKKKTLLKEFNRFGEIDLIRIRSVPLLDDKTPREGAIIKKQINDAVDRVNAYIVFKMEDSAEASLSHNMALVGGNHIRVDRACPPRKKLKGENAPLKRTVFIRNLPFDLKDEQLYELFNNLKDCIEEIRVVRDPGTSIAFVLFTTREAANTVVRKHKLKIGDRELRLSHAMKTNSTPSKRKESESESESTSENALKRKVRSEKRPAAANTGGMKRKQENQSNSRNKKPRIFG